MVPLVTVGRALTLKIVARILPGTLTYIGFGWFDRVTWKVLSTIRGSLLTRSIRQPRPATGTETLQALILRKVLALTTEVGIRLAT